MSRRRQGSGFRVQGLGFRIWDNVIRPRSGATFARHFLHVARRPNSDHPHRPPNLSVAARATSARYVAHSASSVGQIIPVCHAAVRALVGQIIPVCDSTFSLRLALHKFAAGFVPEGSSTWIRKTAGRRFVVGARYRPSLATDVMRAEFRAQFLARMPGAAMTERRAECPTRAGFASPTVSTASCGGPTSLARTSSRRRMRASSRSTRGSCTVAELWIGTVLPDYGAVQL